MFTTSATGQVLRILLRVNRTSPAKKIWELKRKWKGWSWSRFSFHAFVYLTKPPACMKKLNRKTSKGNCKGNWKRWLFASLTFLRIQRPIPQVLSSCICILYLQATVSKNESRPAPPELWNSFSREDLRSSKMFPRVCKKSNFSSKNIGFTWPYKTILRPVAKITSISMAIRQSWYQLDWEPLPSFIIFSWSNMR